VFWQVGGAVELGATSRREGAVFTATTASLRTGASIDGRLCAQTKLDLDGSVVVAPE